MLLNKCIRRFLLVCLAGLEPTTSTSEVDILSSQTTGIFYNIIQFLFSATKCSKEKFCKLLSTTFQRFKHQNCVFVVGFHPCINATTRYCKIKRLAQTIYCVSPWITFYRRRPVLYPAELRVHFFSIPKKCYYILLFFAFNLQAFMIYYS